MTVRLELICHAPTVGTRRAEFAANQPMDEHAKDDARRLAASDRFLERARRAVVVRGPSPACVGTAAALTLEAASEDALADWNLGAWRGRTLDEVHRERPGDVLAWLTDPTAIPHGGESLEQLHDRVSAWLDSIVGHPGRVIAVTPPALIRAAVVHVLSAPIHSFWRVDVDPLSITRLSGRERRWTLNLR